MSDPHETGGRPLASTIQQPEGTTTRSSSIRRKRRRDSQSSDERIGGTKSTSSSRRLGPGKEVSSGTRTGSSRGHSSTLQRSISPAHLSPEMASINYTRTGRVSKAKKGLKVHNCECGRSYTRAEHLRRHQKNHASESALVCEFPDCGKTFYRLDLLQRHQERHNEMGKDSRRTSLFSQGTSAEAGPQVSAPINSIPASSIVTTLPQQASSYYSQTAPLPEASPNPSHNKQASYSARVHTPVAIPVGGDGLTAGIGWNDSFGQSPQYSSSSGYGSPIPGGDYANIFAQPPYVPGNGRTRTSSNASFIEPWGYPSRSPTSATSTMAYTWSSDKATAPANLAYMNTTSYSLTSVPMTAGVDQMSGYGHFGPKSLAQRDEEEQAYLFPEQAFGCFTPPFLSSIELPLTA